MNIDNLFVARGLKGFVLVQNFLGGRRIGAEIANTADPAVKIFLRQTDTVFILVIIEVDSDTNELQRVGLNPAMRGCATRVYGYGNRCLPGQSVLTISGKISLDRTI